MALTACSSGEQEPEPAEEIDPGAAVPDRQIAAATTCQGSETGCPCANEGDHLDCGTISEQRGSYVICSMGTRSCTDGAWSDCVGSSVRELDTGSAQTAARDLRLQALTAAGDCKNLCDPRCMAFTDNAAGLTVGDDLLADPGGLTLPGGASGGTCSDLSILPLVASVTISTINANGSVVATPPSLALTANCAGGAPVQPSWTMDAYDRAVINGSGALTVFSGIASPILVTAASSADSKTRLVDVVVRMENRGTDSAVATALDGVGSADTGTASKTLYPYKNTVFPLDLESPLVQWDPGTSTATAVKVALRFPAGSTTPSFWYSKIFNGSEPKQGTIMTGATAWKIPQEIWSAFDRSAAGSATGGEIIVQRYYGGSARTAMKIPVKFATAALSGTVYYTQYLRSLFTTSSSTTICSGQPELNPATYTPGPTNTCAVGLCIVSSAAGSATTRAIDLSKVSAPNKDPFNGTAGCPVCHSVSVSGTRYVSVNQASQTYGGGTSKGIDNITLDALGDPVFAPIGTAPTYTGPSTSADVNGEESYGFSFGALAPDGAMLLQGPGYWGNTLDQPSANNTLDGTMKGITNEMKPYFFVDTNKPGAGVQFATTAALPLNALSAGVLTASVAGALTIDGVAMASGYAVLVKDETGILGNQAKNGVYTVTNAGSGTATWKLTRRVDMDTTGEIAAGMEVRVTDGNANRGKVFYVSTPTSGSPSINSAAILFSQRVYPAIAYTAAPLVAKYATAAALPAYAVSGDVLTATTAAILTVDGQTIAPSESVLVKNEGTQKNNGVYTLTSTVNNALTKWKLQRRSDFDSAPSATSDALPGMEVKIQAGSSNAGKVFAIVSPTSGAITINTSAIVFKETALPGMMVPTFSPNGRKVAYINADADPLPGAALAGWRRGLSVFDFDPATMSVSGKKRLLGNYSASSAGMPVKWPFFEPDSRSLLYVKTDPNEYCSSSADSGNCATPATDTYAATTCTADSAGSVNTNIERSCYQGSRGSMTPTTRGFWPGRIYSIDTAPSAPTTPLSTEIELQKLNNADDDGGLDDATDAGKSYQPTVLPFSVGGYRWVIFTSPRPYGNQFNMKGTHFSCGASMLWVSALKDSAANGTDRSNPAFFLPGQHVAAITTLNHYVNERGYLVPSLCKAAGASCSSNGDCCGGTASPATAACRAPISWTPAAGPPAKTCATLSGTCSNAGQSCNSPSDCCNAAACVDFKCAAPPVFEAADFTRDYVAECPDSYLPRWQLLSFYLTTEGNSRLEFKVQTAPTLAALATATPYDLGQSTNDVVSPGTPDFKDVGAVLDAANINGRDHARLTIRFVPSTGGQYAPILHDWELRYRCEAAQ